MINPKTAIRVTTAVTLTVLTMATINFITGQILLPAASNQVVLTVGAFTLALLLVACYLVREI